MSETIKRIREVYGLTQEDLAKIADVSFQAVSTWERGKREPRTGAIERMADYFGVRKSDIIEGTMFDEKPQIANILPILRRKIPLLGNIAAGEPIWAVQENEEFVDDDGLIKADFALRVKGDSMAPLIEDGDLVFVQSIEDVRDGQIAVVLTDDCATLKIVYHQTSGLQLVSLNPSYPPMFANGENGNQLRILGLAVSYKRSLLKK